MADDDDPFFILIQRIYWLLVLYEAGRAGIDVNQVLALKNGASADSHPAANAWQQASPANGCRHVALYMAHTSFGIPIKPLAKAAGLSHQAVSRICHKIEDAREDAHHHNWLEKIEAVLNG